MKKILAIAIALVMVISVMPLTASADDGQVSWSVCNSAQAIYEPDKMDEDDFDYVPGYKYTADGLQFFTAEDDQLKAMGITARGSLQTTETYDLTKGFTMTATMQKYDEANADKWISFSIYNYRGPSQGGNSWGYGWCCLIRPNATGIDIQSFISDAANGFQHLGSVAAAVNVYNGEELSFDLVYEDNAFSIVICDQVVPLDSDRFSACFEDNMGYIGMTLHNGTSMQAIATVTEFNGVKPQGTDSAEPAIPEGLEEAAEKGDTPYPEAGLPCYLWTPAEEINDDGDAGSFLTGVLNDDGTATMTIGNGAAQLNEKIESKYWYGAEDYPVFAIKFKDLDEVAGGVNLWFCAGEVLSAREDSYIMANWADCDDDINDEENGWSILTFDLSYETTWEERINGFRLDFTGDNSFNGAEFQLAWCGFFASEEDAYNYAEMGDTWDAYYGDSDDDDATTEAPADTNEGDATTEAPAGDETGAGDATTAAPSGDETDKTDDDAKGGVGAWLWIVIGVAVVAVVAVVIVVIKKKK